MTASAQNIDKISDACRKEEISLSVLQASNTELMPNIANACKVKATRASRATTAQGPALRYWHSVSLHWVHRG